MFNNYTSVGLQNAWCWSSYTQPWHGNVYCHHDESLCKGVQGKLIDCIMCFPFCFVLLLYTYSLKKVFITSYLLFG